MIKSVPKNHIVSRNYKKKNKIEHVAERIHYYQKQATKAIFVINVDMLLGYIDIPQLFHLVHFPIYLS